MPWWAWIILGAVLLGAEVIIAADFYLVFFGVSALVVGLLMLAGLAIPVWAQGLGFAALAVLLLVFYRRRLKAKLQRPDRELDSEIVGELGSAIAAIAVGGEGKVELRGTLWSARNVGEVEMSEGDRARVVEKDGLFLHVRRDG